MTKKVEKRNKPSLRTVTKRKGVPQTNPNSLANLKPFEPGQSGNPGGRPKLLGEAYKAKLARVVPGDEEGRTYAEVMADAIALEVIKGSVSAAHEIRSATEGDRVVFEDAWKSEVVEHLKAGTLKPDDVIEALGVDDARAILISAGQTIPANLSTEKDAAGSAAPDPGAAKDAA